MRKRIALALVLASAGIASAQTPTGALPPAQAGASSSDTRAQLAMMRAAQDAQNDLRSLMQAMADAGAKTAPARAATSNPCERSGYGASLSCIDTIRRNLARASLPAAEKSQVEADLSILRDSLREAQYAGSPRKREARLAEARVRAERLDAVLGKLAEPRAPATAGLSLDKLVPALTN
jgi:hypothetical protein